MRIFNNVLETIGNTPLIKINKLTKDIPALVLAKVETTNPGNSVKDRMAVKMIEDAEKAGILKPGGTVIEGTSGNTGMGLALACIIKGYKLICVLNDKQSKEKMDILRAVGAEVVVCPTAVEPTDPRSYYSVSRRLATEIPNSWYVNQYDNLSNRTAHYEQTGPEIWEQMEGRVDALVFGAGSGGTFTGIARYIKHKNPQCHSVVVQPVGSIYQGAPLGEWAVEGVGNSFMPGSLDMSLCDEVIDVLDADSLRTARELILKEGCLVGGSSGANAVAALQVAQQLGPQARIVTLFCDGAERYMSKQPVAELDLP